MPELYVSLAGENAVVALNGSFKEEHRIYVERPGRIRVHNRAVYGAYADGLFALSLSGEVLFTAYAGAGACDFRLTADGSRAYALCADADAVSVLSIDGGQSDLLQCVPTGGYPRSIDLSPDESRLIIACAGSGSLMLCGADTLSLIGHRMVRGVPCCAAFCGNYLIASVAVGEYKQEGRLCVFDPMLGRLFGELRIPGTPTTLFPLGDTALVGYIGGVVCADIRRGRILWENKNTGFADTFCLYKDRFIVADLFGNTLHIISKSGESQEKIGAGAEPSGIAVI